MLLTGSYSRAVDEKLRIAVPKRLRDAMQCPDGGVLYIAPGTDRSLAVYTEQAFSHSPKNSPKPRPPGKKCERSCVCFMRKPNRWNWTRKAASAYRPELAGIAGLQREIVLAGSSRPPRTLGGRAVARIPRPKTTPLRRNRRNGVCRGNIYCKRSLVGRKATLTEKLCDVNACRRKKLCCDRQVREPRRRFGHLIGVVRPNARWATVLDNGKVRDAFRAICGPLRRLRRRRFRSTPPHSARTRLRSSVFEDECEQEESAFCFARTPSISTNLHTSSFAEIESPMAEANSDPYSGAAGSGVQGLEPKPGMVLVDGTLGGGGHQRALAERIAPGGLLIALDRDPRRDRCRRAIFGGCRCGWCRRIFAICPRFWSRGDSPRRWRDVGLGPVERSTGRCRAAASASPRTARWICVSTPTAGVPAWRLLERLSAEHLADLIYEFGEERYSRRIAQAVVERRRDNPVKTARDLAELVARCVPRSRDTERIHPATRTFQALRIAVNDELKSLEIALRRIPDCLRPGGRLAIISFHSLEDRRVKEAFQGDARLNVLTRRPLCGPTPRKPSEIPAPAARNSASPKGGNRV